MDFYKAKVDFRRNSIFLILLFSLIELLFHLYTNAFASYGYFRDELYYIACSNHLAAGYVDQPPLSSFILFISIKLFGDSIFALRLLPAITSAITVIITGIITRKLNGGYFAVTTACASLVFAPQFLGTNTIFSMNSFDWLFWSLTAYLVILIIQSDISGGIKASKKYWIWLGIVLGLGLLNKIDILWLGAGLFVGLIFSEQRKYFKTSLPYIAGIIAFVLFLPYIIWNITHDFATLEFMRRAASIKYSSQTPLTFISNMILVMNPLTIPVWLAGIYYLFLHKEGRSYKLIGYIFLVSFIILIINWHSKAEYIAPAFPMLFAGGGVMFEKIALRKSFAWVRYAIPVIIVLVGLILLPLALPILPVESFINYTRTLGIAPATSEGQNLKSLPQYYADMFGWKEMADSVSEVYLTLSPSERNKTVIFAQNYGEAGAIDFFRKDFPLPRVLCGHNTYWYWGPGDTSFTTIIVIGGNKDDLLKTCTTVIQAGMTHCKYSMPYENNLPIYICRGVKIPFAKIWKRVRFFI